MRLPAIVLSLLAVTVGSSAVGGEPTAEDRVRVLLVTGMDHPAHDWRQTAPVLRQLLEQDKRLEARIVEDPDFLAAPATAEYNVIVLHFMNAAPLRHEQAVRENLAKLVKDGRGLVLIHFASGAFEGWPEFATLAGRIWDRKTTHDPRGLFTVKIVDREHAITQGLTGFQADDELYTCLVGDRSIDVLATAQSKVTGREYPMAFAFEYGKGRVFHTPLGHDVRALQVSGVTTLIRRGCCWTAKLAP